MGLSSPGIGSNLDVNGIVSKLMDVERQPLAKLDQREAAYQAQISAYGSLKGALSSFQTSLQGLKTPSRFQALTASTSDGTVASASASSAATPGSYSLEVSKLAQPQKLAAAGQTSTAAAIGNGTLTFDFGTISGGTLDPATGKYTGASFTSNGAGVKTVVIDASNNSLAGIRDAINAAKIGVTAAIVNDGSSTPYRLVLSPDNPGKANSLKISASGDAALSSLVAQDPAGVQNLSETVTAQNAEFKVDGVVVSKSSNTVTDAIPGVTLNLLKTNAGSPSSITVARDTAGVKSAVEGFVKAYNDLNKSLTDLSSYNSAAKQGAILQGDSTVRSLQAQLRGTLSSSLTGTGSSYTTLSQIGVSFQKDGTLAVDSAKLQTAIDNSFSDIAGLFAATGRASDSLVSYASATDKTLPGSYAVTVTQLASQGTAAAGAAAGLTITAGVNDTLDVTLDGVSSTVTLAPGTYATADALATEVQSRINGVQAFSGAGSSVAVTQAGGALTLTSSRYGSASNVSITGGNGQTSLGFASATNVAGADVAGTINGTAATGAGQYLTGATGNDAEGLKIQISGGAPGSRGTVSHSQGYAYQLSKLADSWLAADGPIFSRTEGIGRSIKDIGNQRDTLNRRLEETEKRYRAQFTSLDTMLSSMSQTSSFLEQQLANLSKNNS